MSLDYAEERRMLDAVAALGWRYDKATRGFVKSNGDWVSWPQLEQMWLAAQDGREVAREDIRGESQTIARSVTAAVNEQAANDE